MKVKLMTFNLRIANAGDGINAFDNRKERVRETIMYESPDVVGFQEASDGMIDWIKVAIRSKYVVVGTGRNADRTGEGARIAFKKKKFELVSLETIWLSETPNIPGSCYSVDQSTCPRVFTAIELMDKKTKKIFRVINTHLDHRGELARVCGATQIVQYISVRNKIVPCPNVLMGDLNAHPDSDTIKILKAHIPDIAEEVGQTFHGFGKIEKDPSIHIDYIFSDAKKAAPSYAVPDESVGGVYISDHYPVCSFIEF